MNSTHGRAGAVLSRARFPLAAFSALAIAGTAGAIAAGPAISTLAGNGEAGFSGDSGPAATAALNSPRDVSALPNGGYLVADTTNHRIRRVGPDGVITTVAGHGHDGFRGDGEQARDAHIEAPAGVAALEGNAFLISDTGNDVVRKVASNGVIQTVAGDPDEVDSDHDDDDDNGSADLEQPRGLAPLADGAFLVADSGNHVVRRIEANGDSTIVAGTGTEGYSGDGGDATAAELDKPADVVALPGGGFLVSDLDRGVVRIVNAEGRIGTILGSDAPLDKPNGLAFVSSGGFVVAEEGAGRVQRFHVDGTVEVLAGTGEAGFTGDGAEALAAQLNAPRGLTVEHHGDLLVADSGNNRIRRIELTASGPGNSGTAPGQLKKELDDVPAPVLGEAVSVAPATGKVRVKKPGKGGFELLDGAASLPVGTVFDARHGTVSLRSAVNAEGLTQTASFWAGVFQVRQRLGSRGFVEIVMKGRPGGCKAKNAQGGKPRAGTSRRRKVRRLWGKDNRGRFRTRGGNSVATTRGTQWLTVERCDGTLTRVVEGAVSVRNLRSGRKVLVEAGERYLAKRAAKGARKR